MKYAIALLLLAANSFAARNVATTSRLVGPTGNLPLVTGSVSFKEKHSWAKTDGVDHVFFETYPGSGNSFFQILKTSASDLSVVWDNAGSIWVRDATSYTLNAGSWNTITATYNTAGTITLYLNGTSIGSATGTPATVATTPDTWKIGNRYDGSLPCDCTIEDVGVWNIELTSGQATALAACGASPFGVAPTGLVNEWVLAGSSLLAQTGATNLTATGTTSVADESCGNVATNQAVVGARRRAAAGLGTFSLVGTPSLNPQASPSATITATADATPSVGQMVVISISGAQGSPISSITGCTDNQTPANTYAIDSQHQNASTTSLLTALAHSVVATASGSFVVTCTGSATSYWASVISRWSVPAGTFAVEGAANADNTNTPIACGTSTPTGARSALSAVAFTSGYASATGYGLAAVSPWVIPPNGSNEDGAVSTVGGMEYYVIPATSGSYSPSFTNAVGGTTTCVTATYTVH